MNIQTLHRYSRIGTKAAFYSLVLLWLIWIWAPLLWAFTRGFAVNPTTYPPQLIPEALTLEHFYTVFSNGNFHTYLINSTIVTTVGTIASVTIGSLASYSIIRYDAASANSAFMLLSTRFLPPVAVAIPLYLMFLELGWVNTLRALVVTYFVLGIAFSTWIMLIFFKRIPVEIEEASRLDGWSRLQTWRRVVLPMAAPGIMTAALFNVIAMWNEYAMALILTTNQDAQTVPIFLAGFVTSRGILWGQMGAATLISVTPIIIFSFIAQEKLLAGFSMVD